MTPPCRVLRGFEPAFAGGIRLQDAALAEAYRVVMTDVESLLIGVGSKLRVQHHVHGRALFLYHKFPGLSRERLRQVGLTVHFPLIILNTNVDVDLSMDGRRDRQSRFLIRTCRSFPLSFAPARSLKVECVSVTRRDRVEQNYHFCYTQCSSSILVKGCFKTWQGRRDLDKLNQPLAFSKWENRSYRCSFKVLTQLHGVNG